MNVARLRSTNTSIGIGGVSSTIRGEDDAVRCPIEFVDPNANETNPGGKKLITVVHTMLYAEVAENMHPNSATGISHSTDYPKTTSSIPHDMAMR
jgi:hypothetical protein